MSVNIYTGPMRLAGLFVLLALVSGVQAARIQDARPLMGTVVEVIAEGAQEPALRAAAEEAFREMRRLSDMMNHYDPASVVSAINEAAGARPVPIAPELAEVLAQARRVSERTGGAFDVTIGGLRAWRFRPGEARVPEPAEIAGQLRKVDYRKLKSDGRSAFLAEPGMRIDLGGIAKLYILEAGRRLLEARGVRRALINGGGDVVAHSNGALWRVGVRDPRAPERLLGTVTLLRGCVASSGDYERFFERDGKRFHHILDPRSGYPAEGARGVTLVAPSIEAVNGLGPAIMVLGVAAGGKLIAATPGVEALIVDRAGELSMSPGMRITPAR
jgi:thiamine biosynthesis lipoprotein